METATLLATAFTLHRAGRLDEAAACYADVLRGCPDEPTALNNLGAIRLQTGAYVAAVTTLTDLVANRPDDAIGRSNLGHALVRVGQPKQAETHLRRAVALAPDFAQAHNHLGMALVAQGRADDAAIAFSRALELQPSFAEAAANLGHIMNDRGEGDRAAAAYQAWLCVDPTNGTTLAGLALAAAMQGHLDQSATDLERLTQAHPEDAQKWQMLGLVRYWDGRLVEAEAAARRALELQPDLSEATFLIAGSLLGRGEFAAGWREFERRPIGGGAALRLRFPYLPRWNGGRLPGTLVLHGEQGLGDVVQFSRYLPRVIERAGGVVLLLDEHWASLAPLFTSVPGIDATFTDSADIAKAGAPAISAYASILSLPSLFDGQVATIPNDVPYLSAPPNKVDAWAKRLAEIRLPKVGVAWAAHARAQLGYVTKHKSVPFPLIARLLETPGISFFSLQKNEPGSGRDPDAAAGLADYSAEFHDFGDTAGLIANLDLVITTDTSVAHVAGALGQTVWMLDRYNTCWRWRLSATESPWYPTMRIFRQPSFADWESVLREVAANLAEWARTCKQLSGG